MAKSPATRDFAVEAACLLADRHCEDVLLMDVRGLSQVCDYLLIGSGTSDRQMKSLALELEELGAERQNKVFRSSRDEGGTWIVIDFVDLVTHLFEPNMRAYYDLETLWSDAQTVDWRRANGEVPSAAARATAVSQSKAGPQSRAKSRSSSQARSTPSSRSSAPRKPGAAGGEDE